MQTITTHRMTRDASWPIADRRDRGMIDSFTAHRGSDDLGKGEIERILDGATIIVHGLDGVVTRWTGGCEELYGWKREEALGRLVHELLATEFAVPADEVQRDLLANGVWTGEVRQRRKDGQVLHVPGNCQNHHPCLNLRE